MPLRAAGATTPRPVLAPAAPNRHILRAMGLGLDDERFAVRIKFVGHGVFGESVSNRIGEAFGSET